MQEHINIEVEEEIAAIQKRIQSFFSLEVFVEPSDLTSKDEFYDFLSEFWLALYGVIQKGWTFIQRGIAEWEITLKASSLPAKDIEAFIDRLKAPKTPGEALIQMIEDYQSARLSSGFEYSRFLQKSIYTTYLDCKKFRGKKPASQKAHLKKLHKLLGRSEQFYWLKSFCIDTCKANSSSDRFLEMNLKTFDDYREKLKEVLGCE